MPTKGKRASVQVLFDVLSKNKNLLKKKQKKSQWNLWSITLHGTSLDKRKCAEASEENLEEPT